MAAQPYVRPERRDTIPVPIPVPPESQWHPCPDKQDFQMLKGDIMYDGETGKPLFNRSTNQYYIG